MRHVVASSSLLGLLLFFCLPAAQAQGSSALAGVDRLVNDNAGASGTANFTQSEASVVAFGNTVVLGYNDSGSFAGPTSKFTGFSYSTDGGTSFIDGGSLPNNAGGDAGVPVLARNETTGRIYFATAGFSVSTVQVFRSDTNGATWLAPVNGTPGGGSEERHWVTVDNYPGPGNGNVYLVSRTTFEGIRLYRSTDHGATFGPVGGVEIVLGPRNGAFVIVGPDHSVYVFWYAFVTEPLSQILQVRRSTDQGVSFGPFELVVAGLNAPNGNGDLGLTGMPQGNVGSTAFRSNTWPQAAVNPISGHLYAVYNDNVPGADKSDVFMKISTDNGTTWSSPVRINDDATTTDQWMPAIALTPDGNQLGIFYYSRQDDSAGNNLFKYYGRLGSISGSVVMFGPSTPISDTSSFPEYGRDGVVNAVYLCDYNTACATPNGVFHVVWSDARDDLPGGGSRKDPNVYYDQVVLGTTGVPEVASPLAVHFDPAAPNPFQGSTMITFDQPMGGNVTLAVYSATGALLGNIVQGPWQAGRHQVTWNGDGSGGRPLPAGVYFIRLEAGSHFAQQKLVKLP